MLVDAVRAKSNKNVSIMTAVDLDLCEGSTSQCVYEHVKSGMAGCFTKHVLQGQTCTAARKTWVSDSLTQYMTVLVTVTSVYL